MTQRVIPITSPSFIQESDLDQPIDWRARFGNDNPLALEIGCGIGDFVLQLARRHPRRNFLAIDIYNKGCLKTCKKIDAEGLTNVRVARAEARYFIGSQIGAGQLAAVYINCPDPWPKKRHRKRRLVNDDFLRRLLHHLAPEGELHFSTDFTDYGEQVAATLDRLDGYRNRLTDPVEQPPGEYPVSKYMQRFLELGQPIHYVHRQKRPGFPAGAGFDSGLESGFRVPPDVAANG